MVAAPSALPWCSIDNEGSLDLDQPTCSEPLPDGTLRILVAVADVDSLVAKASPQARSGAGSQQG